MRLRIYAALCRSRYVPDAIQEWAFSKLLDAWLLKEAPVVAPRPIDGESEDTGVDDPRLAA